MNSKQINSGRNILGLIGLSIGLAAIFWFDSLKQYFLFISQDNNIAPLSLLELQICFITLGLLGVGLLFWNQIVVVLSKIDSLIARTSPQRLLLWLLTTALLLRLAVALFYPVNLWVDYQQYDYLGSHWALTGGYFEGEHPTAYIPPGYPFLLSRLYLLFGHNHLFGVVANVLFSVTIVLLTYLLIARLWDHRRAGWTALILTFFPSQIFFVNLLASEPLFTVLFLGSILTFVSVPQKGYKKYLVPLAGGLLLGLATLTRAITLVYLFIPALYWLLSSGSKKRKLLTIALACLGLALIVAPWMMRNHNLGKRFVISTNGGINLLIGNEPGSGMGWHEPNLEGLDFFDPQKEAYVDSLAWAKGMAYIKADPIAFLKRGCLKMFYFMAIDLESVHYELKQSADNYRFDRFVVLGLLVQCFYTAIVFVGLMGIFNFYKIPGNWKSREAFIMSATILLWVAVHFVFFANGRFHYPIVPLLAAWSAIEICRLTSAKA